MKKTMDDICIQCAEPRIVRIVVTNAKDEILDIVYLCAKCSRKPIEALGLSLGAISQ
jgi:hypothetical protein